MEKKTHYLSFLTLLKAYRQVVSRSIVCCHLNSLLDHRFTHSIELIVESRSRIICHIFPLDSGHRALSCFRAYDLHLFRYFNGTPFKQITLPLNNWLNSRVKYFQLKHYLILRLSLRHVTLTDSIKSNANNWFSILSCGSGQSQESRLPDQFTNTSELEVSHNFNVPNLLFITVISYTFFTFRLRNVW